MKRRPSPSAGVLRWLGRLVLLAALAALPAWLAAPDAQAQGRPGMGGPKSVGTITLEQQSVPFDVLLPGRAVAFEEVDIRPRVAGVISEIDYEPGRTVDIGDLLFRIEGDTFQADLASAKAEVAHAEAALSAAQATYDRYQKLSGTGVTAESVDSARVAVLQAQATLSSAQAARDTAQLNLDRTEIRSPIKGVVDVSSVSVGAIVTANQTTALTTVTRLDPIYVDVEESSKRIQEVRNRIDAGTLEVGEALKISLKLETGETYARAGTMVSPGSRVSTTTGTTEFRMQFDNPDRVIMPGQFLRVQITLGTTKAILVPQRATSRAADGTLTAFVVEDGKAVQKTLTEEGTYQNAWIVTKGVEVGDVLVVDGLRNLRDGAEVKTVAVTISADGLVANADGSSEAFGAPAAPGGADGAAPGGGGSGDEGNGG